MGIIKELSTEISNPVSYTHLQPMNANFGIIEGLEKKVKVKKTERYRIIAERSLKILKHMTNI